MLCYVLNTANHVQSLLSAICAQAFFAYLRVGQLAVSRSDTTHFIAITQSTIPKRMTTGTSCCTNDADRGKTSMEACVRDIDLWMVHN